MSADRSVAQTPAVAASARNHARVWLKRPGVSDCIHNVCTLLIFLQTVSLFRCIRFVSWSIRRVEKTRITSTLQHTDEERDTKLNDGTWIEI